MKRYKMLSIVETGMGKPDELKPSQMFEDSEGEWVKWEDVKQRLEEWGATTELLFFPCLRERAWKKYNELKSMGKIYERILKNDDQEKEGQAKEG